MRNTLIALSFSIFALASSGRSASAQERAIQDSVAPSPVDKGPVVDTSSHKWTYSSARDRLRTGCVGSAKSPTGYLLPTFCIHQTTGVIHLAGFDSTTFLEQSRMYQIAVRNVAGIPLLNRQQHSHALTGALIGGGVGFLTSAFANGGSAFGSRNLILGGAGAMIGAFSQSKWLTDWPRVLKKSTH